jgi:hypothetical protein
MNSQQRVLAVVMTLSVLPLLTIATDGKAVNQSTTKPQVATSAISQTVVSPLEKPKGNSTSSVALGTQSGEQIKWQVIGGGGGRGISTNYVLTGTVGQTAAGPATSTNFKINQGF